jgi:dephospho-CoA kinase
MILGITGTIGAGKGTVVDYLVKKHGFTHYSVRDAITEEILRRGLPVNRPNLNEVATDLRRTHGPSHFGDFFRARAEEQGVTDFIIESIRNPKEAERIHEHGGFILVVDAPEHARYERVVGRGSHTDKVTFEEFQVQEAREMTSEDPSDPSYMDIKAVMRMADATIMNDGSLKQLEAKIEDALTKLKK